jgi:probable phosphoglycerate mutase/uncharacterized phosphatase
MTTLCLIRHGQTDWNKKFLIQGRENNPLNEEGITQAHITANLLLNNDSNWDVIISSPLIRAVQTAEIIKDKLNLKSPIIINNNVIEREFGAAEGLTISEEVYDRINNDDYDNLETCKELQKRSMDTIIDIVKSFPNQKILIITHSHFIKGLLTQIDSNFTWTSSLKNASINYVYLNELNIIDYKTNVEYKK